MNLEDYPQRLSRHYCQQRLGLEGQLTTQTVPNADQYQLPLIYRLFKQALHYSGLAQRGLRNSLNIALTQQSVYLKGLPQEFEGYRILHLSDLHLDMHPQYPQRIREVVEQAEYDICVMTGDFRGETFGPVDDCLQALAYVKQGIAKPTFGVLGNHDSLSMANPMEAMGIQLLFNEHHILRQGQNRIYLLGVDDPHFFKMDQLEQANQGIPADDVRILLTHSPENYRQAAASRVNLLLCGHTHGGQICLPGGIPLFVNAKAPRRFCRGRWRYQGMQGFTSRGTGSSIVTARFNCQPEMTIHHLHRG